MGIIEIQDGPPCMGVYFFEKSLSFQSPILCVVFKILKLPQNLSFKLGYFQKKREKFAKNEEKIQKSRIMNKKHIFEEILQKIA